MERHYKALELDKILERLAASTACSKAREAALSLTPASSLSEALRLCAETDAAYISTARYGAPSFGGLCDISGLLRRAETGGTLSCANLLDIAGVLRAVRTIKSWGGHSLIAESPLFGYFELLSPNKYLEDKITGAILSEDQVSDRASAELADIRRKSRNLALRAREHLEKLIRSSSYQRFLQDSIITMRDDRFVVPVKAEHRGDVPGLVHDTSSTGATVFVEPMAVVEYNNEIKLLAAREQAEIERILSELSAEVGTFAESLRYSAEAAVELNVIFAKAALAYSMKAVMPDLNEKGEILLKKARHPLIESNKVVPTDIALGIDYSALIITGPNTGGKTVALKTVGLLTLMAMCGLMIPAAEGSKISVFRYILADIGDEQSIEQSLSTFSSHIANIVSIFDVADADSLILLDELGAGTDPVEGAALAIAIIEELRQRGAKIAATTHYAELKSFALDTEGVENAGCEFDVETLRPTYRILIGIPGRSNAFAISSRLGIPASVIDRAESQVSAEDRRFESVVRSLEAARHSLEAEREQAAQLRLELELQKRKTGEELARSDEERARLAAEARRNAEDIVERTQAQAARLLDEIEDYKKQLTPESASEMAKRARAAMKSGTGRLADTADPAESRNPVKYALPRPLKKGDQVIITDIGQRAEVVETPPPDGSVLVSFGMIQTRVKQDNIRLLDNSSEEKKPARRNVGGIVSRAERDAVSEIDLRGKSADEAILELDAFIDNAFLSGIGQIRIIHGKGTGVLRSAVSQHLKRHPHISSYRLGAFGEGGDGVTVGQLTIDN